LRPSRPVVRTFYGTALDEMRHARTLRRRLFFLMTIPLEHIGARLADHVVGISEATRAHMPAVETLIPCGADLDAFHSGAKSERPTVLFVGTEGGRKRGAWLADLFKNAVLPVLPDAELRIVSEGSGAEPGVSRYGRVPAEQLAELYRSAWVFCLPSTYEGFGVPYIEAMAAGTAVVATSPNEGAREVLADGKYGAFVADDQLAETLARMLSDDAFRSEFERRGSIRCREYGWSHVARRYESLFRDVIASKNARKAAA
jgi:phosphatidyl-myo-inositol alpha-mannosyltransferase